MNYKSNDIVTLRVFTHNLGRVFRTMNGDGHFELKPGANEIRCFGYEVPKFMKMVEPHWSTYEEMKTQHEETKALLSGRDLDEWMATNAPEINFHRRFRRGVKLFRSCEIVSVQDVPTVVSQQESLNKTIETLINLMSTQHMDNATANKALLNALMVEKSKTTKA